MAAITSAHIAAAYELAKRMHDEGLAESEAIRQLAQYHGMKRSSADAYLGAHRHMMAGDVYKRTISAEAVRFYLWSILSDRGHKAAVLALASVNAHIPYYESVGWGKIRGVRGIASEFRALVEQEDPIAAAEVELAAGVERSLKLTPEQRGERLAAAGAKPAVKLAQVRIYVRNPDVVAEALLRAAGKCDGCGSAAPFLRKANASPYLEVHHIRRLADGGDDTVANAEALCPNCHRQRHYG